MIRKVEDADRSAMKQIAYDFTQANPKWIPFNTDEFISKSIFGTLEFVLENDSTKAIEGFISGDIEKDVCDIFVIVVDINIPSDDRLKKTFQLLGYLGKHCLVNGVSTMQGYSSTEIQGFLDAYDMWGINDPNRKTLDFSNSQVAFLQQPIDKFIQDCMDRS